MSLMGETRAVQLLATLRASSAGDVEKVQLLDEEAERCYDREDHINVQRLHDAIRPLLAKIKSKRLPVPSENWLETFEEALNNRQELVDASDEAQSHTSSAESDEFDVEVPDDDYITRRRVSDVTASAGASEDGASPSYSGPDELDISSRDDQPHAVDKSNLNASVLMHEHSALGIDSVDAAVTRTEVARRSEASAQRWGSQDGASSLDCPATLSARPESEDPWFQNLAEQTHNLIFGPNGSFKLKGSNRIKIAVLDSGLAYHDRREMSNLIAMQSSVAGGESFIDDGPWNQDESGHGTAVASLIAKTAPNAALYIARVSRFSEANKKTTPDKDAVERAIRHAVDVWKVDIINMSFGWPNDDHEGVDRAVNHAWSRYVETQEGPVTKKPVLMFAATSNFGAAGKHKIYWPSRSLHVISVDSADNHGNEAPETSSTEDSTTKLRFTAPGVGVLCNWPLKRQPTGTASGQRIRQSGSSYACGVVSGIAALVLEFANQEPCSLLPQISERLHKQTAMEHVLLNMSDVKAVQRFRFLWPWKLLVGGFPDSSGGDGSPPTSRWNIANDLAKMLDDEHGITPPLQVQLYNSWGSRIAPM